MKIFNSDTPVITLEMENGETTVDMIGGKRVEVIIVKDGARRIANGAFKYCPNVREIRLPRSITFIGDRIFECKYSEVRIVYEGTADEFGRIDYEREIYESGEFDGYPYYSACAASSRTESFYKLDGKPYMYCEVVCQGDGTTLTFGNKR